MPTRVTHTITRLSRLVVAGMVPLLAAAPAVAVPMRHSVHHTGPTEHKLQTETVEQRIATLHTALAITPGEEADWGKVAGVMRRNEAKMQTLVTERKATIGPVSAVDDLRIYASFGQAHVDGLADLIAAFNTLYAEMPGAQQATADRVFHSFGRSRPGAQS